MVSCELWGDMCCLLFLIDGTVLVVLFVFRMFKEKEKIFCIS